MVRLIVSKVVQQFEGLPHSLVVKRFAAQIEEIGLYALGRVVGRSIERDLPVVYLGNFISGAPALGTVLGSVVNFACLECFNHNFKIAVIIVTDRIYITQTDVDRKILAPVIVQPFIGNRPSCVQLWKWCKSHLSVRVSGRFC